MGYTMWKTYQSSGSSKDIPRWHAYGEYNPDGIGSPMVGASDANQLMVESSGLYRNGNPYPYRFAQSMRQSWFTDNFDWDTEVRFQIERFDAQFGERYEQEITSLPSYDESRLLYGR